MDSGFGFQKAPGLLHHGLGTCSSDFEFLWFLKKFVLSDTFMDILILDLKELRARGNGVQLTELRVCGSKTWKTHCRWVVFGRVGLKASYEKTHGPTTTRPYHSL